MARQGIKVHLPTPIKRKRKWVFILWISRAPGRGEKEESQRARIEPPHPLPGLSLRGCSRGAQSAGGTCCLNCSNPKAEPRAGGERACGLKASRKGWRGDCPTFPRSIFFFFHWVRGLAQV